MLEVKPLYAQNCFERKNKPAMPLLSAFVSPLAPAWTAQDFCQTYWHAARMLFPEQPAHVWFILTLRISLVASSLTAYTQSPETSSRSLAGFPVGYCPATFPCFLKMSLPWRFKRPERAMVFAHCEKDPAFVSDLSSPLKSLIFAFEAACGVCQCHGLSLFLWLPQPLPFHPAARKSPCAQHRIRALWYPLTKPPKRGRGQEASSQMGEAASPSRLELPCVEGTSAQILPASTAASSTVCPKAQGSCSTWSTLGNLPGPPCPACLRGGGLVSAPAQPPLSWRGFHTAILPLPGADLQTNT